MVSSASPSSFLPDTPAWSRAIKDHRAFNRTSSLPASILLEKASLLSPQYLSLSARLIHQFGKYTDTRHAVKSATGDLLSLAAQLFPDSISIRSGRQSDFKAEDLMQTGLNHLETAVQAINQRIRQGIVAEPEKEEDNESRSQRPYIQRDSDESKLYLHVLLISERTNK